MESTVSSKLCFRTGNEFCKLIIFDSFCKKYIDMNFCCHSATAFILFCVYQLISHTHYIVHCILIMILVILSVQCHRLCLCLQWKQSCLSVYLWTWPIFCCPTAEKCSDGSQLRTSVWWNAQQRTTRKAAGHLSQILEQESSWDKVLRLQVHGACNSCRPLLSTESLGGQTWTS